MLFSAVAFSQVNDAEKRRADYNGTWVLEKNSSRYGPNKKIFDQTLLYITFKDNEFKITKVFVSDDKAANYGITLFTDKRGEKNNYTGLEGNVLRTSKTHWEKATLVSEYKLTSDSKNFTIGGSERYSLSKDGQKLFIESVQTYPVVPLDLADMIKGRMVFQRKEK